MALPYKIATLLYCFNESDDVLLMERVIDCLVADVTFMLEQLVCELILLVGNSGGAALAAFYQAEAERFSIETMVDVDRTFILRCQVHTS